MALATGPFIHVLGFQRDCRDTLRVEDRKGSGTIFRTFKDWGDVPGDLRGPLGQIFPQSKTGVEVMLNWGWRLWVGCRGGSLAIVSWTRSNTASQDFFFPLTDDGVLIWYTETLPEHRGLGLLPLMLDHVVLTLGTEGTRTAYATCAAYNESSLRGIEKAHFRRIGQGIMRAGSGRGLLWLPSHAPHVAQRG